MKPDNEKELYSFCIVVPAPKNTRAMALYEAAYARVSGGCLLLRNHNAELIKGLPPGEWFDFKRMSIEEAKTFMEKAKAQNTQNGQNKSDKELNAYNN